MSWTNPQIRLYHGTVDIHVASILRGIDLNHPMARSGHDFGKGFYTTTSALQARKWASNLTWQFRYKGCSPAVLRFQVDRDELSRLESLWFVRGDPGASDYWGLVRHFRGNPRGSHHGRAGAEPWYDIVIGPVARDWKRRIAIDRSDQVSFHTREAIDVLDGSDKVHLP